MEAIVVPLVTRTQPSQKPTFISEFPFERVDNERMAFKCMEQALNICIGDGKDMDGVEMIAEVMHELAIIHKANLNMGDVIKTFKQKVAVR